MNLITLTTDFGTADWFVGTMKGVIAGANPGARVIDLTHGIAPGDIRAGAFALMASCHFFPKGTVHLAVVDPGVGSARRAVAVKTADYFFVGPDNGVLSWALARQKVRAIHLLEKAQYFLKPVSRTFHGRDIFAPVAAHLSRRVALEKLGPALPEYLCLPWPEPRRTRGGIEGEIVCIDRFGNCITNLDGGLIEQAGGSASVLLGRRRLPLVSFYQAVAPGKPVAVIGSTGFLEIAVNGGSAARRLKLKAGSAVWMVGYR